MIALAKLRQALSPGQVWSFAVYVQDHPFALQQLPRPARLFNSRRVRFNRLSAYTQADPFPVVWHDRLYVFYEEVVPRGHGTIACVSTHDLQEFRPHGVVLREPHHLSYPFTFEHDGRLFMVPEAGRSGEVPLYEFEEVPHRLLKRRVLLRGDYVDSFVVRRDGRWYLFTTSRDGRGDLELFHTDDILHGDLLPHPCSPITGDPRYARSAGGAILVDGRLFRVAQDCSSSYGRNISLHEIEELDATSFRERLVRDEFFVRKDFWNTHGAHHLATCEFKGRHVIVADGKHEDYLINRLLLRVV